MSAPTQVNDGNFNVARQNGATEWEFPFAHEGDPSAWVATITMRQDQAAFRPLAPMSRINTVRGLGYLVSAEDPKPIGQGLVEWTRVVANIPAKRTVPGGVVTFNIQRLHTETYSTPFFFSIYSVEDFPLPLASTITYEYGIKPFSALVAPTLIVYNEGYAYKAIGDWQNFYAGNNVVAEASDNTLYRGLIHCRATTRCRMPFSF